MSPAMRTTLENIKYDVCPDYMFWNNETHGYSGAIYQTEHRFTVGENPVYK